MNDRKPLNASKLAIVCPMANEAATAERFVRHVLHECGDYPFHEEIFFAILDDVSKDGTRALLETLSASTPELRVVYAPENRNVVDAYVRGYHEALGANADWILEMDAGGSHAPQDISKFLNAIAEPWDCVFGTRFALGGRYAGGVGRRFLISWIGSWIARILLGVPLTDMTGGFQLFSRAALQRVVDHGIESQGPFFQTEIKTFLRHCRIREVPISYRPTGQALRRAALSDAFRVLLRLFVQRFRTFAAAFI